MTTTKINDLRQALEFTPDNHTIRYLLAEALEYEGCLEDSINEYKILFEADAISNDDLVDLAQLAIDSNDIDFANILAQKAQKTGVIDGLKEILDVLDEKKSDAGVLRLLPNNTSTLTTTSGPVISFKDVGGLSDLKKIIHRMIILPNSRPDLLEKYGRKSGGGVLFYGPPGCGKTLLARATAGECGLPFFNVRIEDILNPYIGVSERNLHEVFERARQNAPCVLFLDEIDALGYSRQKLSGSNGRVLVDQLLQELDSIGSENSGVLIIGATNVPWDLDDAIVRPGRFDRTIFVSPPDVDARQAIIKIYSDKSTLSERDITEIAKQTPLFSGADISALIERSIDKVIDEALATNTEPPLSKRHLTETLTEIKPSTIQWLTRSRNFVEFANKSARYDDIEKYLKSPETKKFRL